MKMGHPLTPKVPPRPTIAVDLTPLLPGGENGGAKIFAVGLLSALARMHPEASFVLLTQHASHEELAVLEAPNVRRVVAVGAAASSLRPRMLGIANSLLRLVPRPVRIVAARFAYRLHTALKRGGVAGKALGADLLFCPFTAPTFHARGTPTVCTIYDLQFLVYPQFFTVEDVVQRERAFHDAARKATALAAISEYSRAAAIRDGAVPAARIVAIPLRLARPAPATAAVTALPRLGLEAGRYLVYPANFWRHKNHEVLLAAFGQAVARLAPDIKLVLTGADSERRAALVRAARAMGLEQRVVHAGFLDATEHLQVMANAAGLVFPSLYEGFGMPVAEAMALGVPVACSNAAALPEVAGDAALLFDARVPEQVADAMVALVNDVALRERLVLRGAARAPEFADTERMAREYWALFAAAMAGEAPG